jgi:hypothetical protein
MGHLRKQLLTFVCLVAMLALGGAVRADEATAGKGKIDRDELINQNKFIEEEFRRLLGKISTVADIIEKTEPASAKILRQVVNEAQKAFIARDMQKVADLLRDGLERAAEETQSEVIKELRDLYRLILEGELDIDKRLERIKQMEAFRKQIAAILDKQRPLERTSRLASSLDALKQRMAALDKALKDIIEAQKKLHGETKAADAGDAHIRKLEDLRDQIARMIERQEKIAETTATAGVAKLPLIGEAQKGLAEKAKAVKGELGKAAGDPATVKALGKGEQSAKALRDAEASMGRAGEEMKKAGGALAESGRAAAAPPQKQALADLTEAHKALSDAISAASAGTKAGKLAERQKELEKKTRDLDRAMDDLAGEAGIDRDGGEAARTGSVKRAADEMAKAARKLTGQDTEKAAEHQKKAIKELTGSNPELAQLKRRVMEKATASTEEQAKQQDKLAAQTHGLSHEMKEAGKDRSDQTPGQECTQSASKSMGKAAEQLGRGSCSGANPPQKDAISKLEEALRDIDEAIAREREMAQAEALAKIDALLEKILDRQKVISKETKATDAKREDKDYLRVSSNKLANGEGALADEVENVRGMLVKEGSTVVFPQVLREIKADLLSVQKLLAGQRTGELTQAIQKDIEDSLERLIKAIREELAERVRRGRSGQGPGGGGAPLVPPVAELKMLRLLQLQINSRTRLVNRRQKDGTLAAEVVRQQHRDLAKRESNVRKMTEQIGGKASPRR